MSNTILPVPRMLFLAISFKNWVYPTLYYEQQAIQNLMPQSFFYGPGYNYHTNIAKDIITECFGCNFPDAIFCYIDERRLLGEPLPKEVISQYQICPSLRIFPRGLQDINIPKIAWINDFWHCSRDEWDRILLGNGFQIAFATYAPPFVSEKIFKQFFSRQVRESVQFVPWPRAINTAIFKDYGLEKKGDITLLGARDSSFYPLREIMHASFSQQKDLSFFSQPHPGYRYHTRATALIGENYAKIINQSKIFASCTGKYNIPFIKLYEVLACKTVLMCDCPMGGEYLGLSDKETYLRITKDNFLEEAKRLLKDKQAIDRIARNGYKLFLSRHTVEIRAREFIETLKGLLYGQPAEGWASLYPYRKECKFRVVNPLLKKFSTKHIREVSRPADTITLGIWKKYGLNNRPHEIPPVVTEQPDLVVLRGVYLRQLAEYSKAKYLAEVGTARGFQSFMWAQYLLENFQDGLIYTCDIDGMDKPIYKTPLTDNQILTRRQLWHDSPQSPLIRFVHGDSGNLAQQIDNKLDIVFIDGEHSEKAVMKDFNVFMPHLHSGSIVVFDDCDARFPGVQNAVKRISAQLQTEVEIIEFTPSPYKIAKMVIPPAVFQTNGDLGKKKRNVSISMSTTSSSKQAEVFLSSEQVYLASADRMDRVLQNMKELNSLQIEQVGTYVSVIGGLSGLNYLISLKPRKIVFYDINETMVKYARLMEGLIDISDNPKEFISRIYCRSIPRFLEQTGESDLLVENQDQYLSLPFEQGLLEQTLTMLAPEERMTFETIISPYLAGNILDGKRNCRRLLPCWPIDHRVPVGGGEETGFDEDGNRVPNTNTFFYGHGWLESEESFKNVKTTLSQSVIRFLQLDLLISNPLDLLDLSNNAVFHISNIDDWFPNEWDNYKKLLLRRVVDLNGRLTVISSHNGLQTLQADSHKRAYRALLPHVSGRVVEVTHKVPWGFNEIMRTNVTTSDYLRGAYEADTTILHILVGDGLSRETLISVYKKALELSRWVVVLEHNRTSKDWNPQTNSTFLDEAELRSLLEEAMIEKSASITTVQMISGEKDDRRNQLFVVDTGRKTMFVKPKVLLIADVPDWIFARHCRMLERYLGDEFDFTFKVNGQYFRENEYDLIYPLEWNLILANRIANPQKYVTGIRSHTMWPNLPFDKFTMFLGKNFQQVHVVSKRLFEIFKTALPRIKYISHGVDTEFFRPSIRTDQSGKKLRLGWAGNSNQLAKGFKDFVEPLKKLPNVELVYCGYANRNLTMEEMRDFYDSLDAYICTSSGNEGNNNSLMEACSMERAVITTDNGTIPEYLRDGENALIVPRRHEAFIQAVEKLRDYPELRVRLGEAARRSVTLLWEWEARAEDYRAFFRESILRASFSQVTGNPGHQKAVVEDTADVLRSRTKSLSSTLYSANAQNDISRYPNLIMPDANGIGKNIPITYGEGQFGLNAKKQRLMVISHYFHSGGTENLAFDLAVNLSRLGYDCFLIYITLEGYSNNDLVNIQSNEIEISCYPVKEPNLILSKIHDTSIDTVLALSDISSPLLQILSNMSINNIRKLVYLNVNNEAYNAYRRMKDAGRILHGLRGFDSVVVFYSTGPAANLLRLHNIPFVVISSGIPEISNSTFSIRKQFELPLDQHLIVYPALVAPKKNQVALIQMASEFASNVTLAFLGKMYSGTPKYTNEFLHVLKVSKNCIFVDDLSRNDINKVLSEASLCIFPSLSEGAPLTLLEAMQKGTPWIATPNVDFAKELKGGVIAELFDFPHVVNMLLADSERRRKLGLEGRACFFNKFTIENTAKQFDALIASFDIPDFANKDAPKRKPFVRIAGEDRHGEDLTKVSTESEFALAIRNLFRSKRPMKIIETGTYLGEGTTCVLASALNQLQLTNAIFYSIECNSKNYQQALRNLSRRNLLKRVIVLHGLSVPRNILPTLEEIENECVNNIEYEGIFVDHQEAKRAELYFRETNFEKIPDDLLGVCLKSFNYCPDFVLLDSGGHIGNIEFNYLINHLNGPCFIALDDIYHIKHHRSFLQIQKDPRFTILTSSEEKFGFCIAEFNPQLRSIDSNVQSILWIRTDNLGDNILSASMLPHLRNKFRIAKITVVCQEQAVELYEACPFVDCTVGLNKRRAYRDEGYLSDIVKQIKAINPELTLNSIYSREPIADVLSIASNSEKRIAFNGNFCNISKEIRDKHNALYSSLLASKGEYKPEIERHRDFLSGVGIETNILNPLVWTSEKDEEFADRFFRENNLQAEKTIALFAGVQYAVRSYDLYGVALSKAINDLGFSVVALGSSNEVGVGQENLKATGSSAINLCGKTTLRQTAALLKRCRLAVGAETGLAHMACAVGTPNVILLGGGHFGRFMPYSPLTTVVCLPLECYGCDWHCKYQKIHCLKNIRSDVFGFGIENALKNECDIPRVIVQSEALWKPMEGEPKWKLFNAYLDPARVKIIYAEKNGCALETKECNGKKGAQLPDELYRRTIEVINAGREKEAIGALKLFLELYPQFAVAHNDLGFLYRHEGDQEMALKHYHKAVALAPDNATFQKNLADFYYAALGRVEDALEHYSRALSSKPDDVDTLLMLGHISLSRKKFDEASVFYEMVLKIDPDNKDAKQMIEGMANGKVSDGGRKKTGRTEDAGMKG